MARTSFRPIQVTDIGMALGILDIGCIHHGRQESQLLTRQLGAARLIQGCGHSHRSCADNRCIIYISFSTFVVTILILAIEPFCNYLARRITNQ